MESDGRQPERVDNSPSPKQDTTTFTIGLTSEISVDREQAEFEEKTAREAMQSAELKNGRLAMMAVLGYVVQEAWTRVPVIAETPWLFKPAFLSIANLLTH